MNKSVLFKHLTQKVSWVDFLRSDVFAFIVGMNVGNCIATFIGIKLLRVTGEMSLSLIQLLGFIIGGAAFPLIFRLPGFSRPFKRLEESQEPKD
jgi:hypothetical protein